MAEAPFGARGVGTLGSACAMSQRFLPYTPERDVYRLLGVPPDASSGELLDAWRRLARAFHPDRNDSARSHEEMQVVNALRQLVADPEARAAYDRERQRWLAHSRSGAMADSRERRGSADQARSQRSGAERVAFAVGAGVRAFAIELTPARCPQCAAAIGRRDLRCDVCGAQVDGEQARR
jgi:curved DNA-binding protein CbpA